MQNLSGGEKMGTLITNSTTTKPLEHVESITIEEYNEVFNKIKDELKQALIESEELYKKKPTTELSNLIIDLEVAIKN